MDRSPAMHVEESRPARAKWLPVILTLVALAALSACGSKSSSPTGPGTVKEVELGRFRTRGNVPASVRSDRHVRTTHCIHHSPMKGSVVVSEAAADSLVNVIIVSDHVAFPAASVKPGGRVVWTNNTASVHTVTSD